ncbi:unnamed protein product [Dracunculus medinensis]|uniref:Phosphoglycerate mutase family protein n=1 Tax=Dracunculus medinensis TaxID=318479 RepID=A0A0N4UKG3_DRAME|nr:unnamed protein product [Dracunculus medinensis]
MDVNQAIVQVYRSNSNKDDPSLTQIGYSGAQLVGRSLSNKQLNIHTIYTSPSLRCIQTAKSIVSSLNTRRLPRIRIEYALFEPLAFVSKVTFHGIFKDDKVPKFITKEELTNNKFHFDEKYTSVMNYEELKQMFGQEKTITDFYKRVEHAVNRIVGGKRKRGGIIIISHAPVLDCIFRLLTNRTDLPKTAGDLQRLIHNYPRCSVTTLQFFPENLQWENRADIVPPLSYWHMTTMVNIPDFD